MNNSSKRSPQEMRERAVRMVFEHQDEYDSRVGGHHLGRREVGDDAGDTPEVRAPGRDR